MAEKEPDLRNFSENREQFYEMYRKEIENELSREIKSITPGVPKIRPEEFEERVHIRAGDRVESEARSLEKEGKNQEALDLYNEAVKEYKKAKNSDRLIGAGRDLERKGENAEDDSLSSSYFKLAEEAYEGLPTEDEDKAPKLEELGDKAYDKGIKDIAEDAYSKSQESYKELGKEDKISELSQKIEGLSNSYEGNSSGGK